MVRDFIKRLPAADAPARADVVILIAIGVFIGSCLSTLVASPPIFAAPISPATGIALGCLLLWGSRYWIGVLLGAVPAAFLQLQNAASDGFGNASVGLWSWMLAIVIGSGVALQAVLATKLIRRHVEFPTMLMRERDVLGFFILGGPIAHLFNATLGTIALLASGAIPMLTAATTWWTWWIGDSIGALLCAPLMIMWVRDDAAWSRRRAIVTMPFVATLVATSLFFLYNNRTTWHQLQTRFTEDSRELVHAIEKQGSRNIELLQMMSTFVSTDGNMDSARFDRFSQPLISHHSELETLEWLPITALDSQPAAIRHAGQIAMDRRALIALPLMQSDVTPDNAMPRGTSSDQKVLLLQPVRQSDGGIQSFVIARLSIPRLIDGALRDNSIARLMRLQLDDISSGAPASLLKRDGLHSAVFAEHWLYATPLHEVATFVIGERTWQLQTAPGLEYLDVRREQSNWLELAGALLFTSLIGIGALLITGRARSIETLVGLRTTELAQINEKLAEEICDHLSTEHMLEKERELLKAVLDNLHEGILVLDESGRMQMANDSAQGMLAAITGVESETIPSPRPFRMFTPDGSAELPRDQLPHISALRGRTVRDYELVLQTAGREPLTVIVNAQPLRTADGKQHGAIIAMRDITDTKKVERMKAEFVATVSHELRTPITSIRGSLGLIAGGVAGTLTEKTLHLVRIALRNSDRLALLINDLLDMEKMESGKMDFHLQRESLPQLVEQAIEANAGYAQNHDIVFTLKQPVPSLFVNVDPLRLVQVMSNLLSNAAKFSPANSHVEVSIVAGQLLRRGSARVEVKDCGTGIPAEFRSRIFQKFSQADSSDTRAKNGTGLGLAICKAIVEQMDGVIGYDSQPDKGSTFYFELPLAVDEKPANNESTADNNSGNLATGGS